MNITIQPGKLSGIVSVPPSKSIAHRILICAAFADKPTNIICGEYGDDVQATVDCLQALGAGIQYTEDGYLVSYEGTQIGTGTKISLTADGKTTVYDAVIFGDVDGSGVVDGDDSFIVTMIINGFFTKDTLGNAKWFAADVNFDGTIDAADLDLITKAGLKQHTINQNPDGSAASVTTSNDDIVIEEPEVETPEEETVETTPLTPATINFTAIIEMIKAYIQSIIDVILSFVK